MRWLHKVGQFKMVLSDGSVEDGCLRQVQSKIVLRHIA